MNSNEQLQQIETAENSHRAQFVEDMKKSFPNYPLLLRAVQDGKDDWVLERLERMAAHDFSLSELTEAYYDGNDTKKFETENAKLALEELRTLIQERV